MFRFIDPVEELDGEMAGRKRGTCRCRLDMMEMNMCTLTHAASSVYSKTPLFAYARASLHPRPAIHDRIPEPRVLAGPEFVREHRRVWPQ